MIWLLHPLSRQQVVSLSQSSYVHCPISLHGPTFWREKGGGGDENISSGGEKASSSIIHKLLSDANHKENLKEETTVFYVSSEDRFHPDPIYSNVWTITVTVRKYKSGTEFFAVVFFGFLRNILFWVWREPVLRIRQKIKINNFQFC